MRNLEDLLNKLALAAVASATIGVSTIGLDISGLEWADIPTTSTFISSSSIDSESNNPTLEALDVARAELEKAQYILAGAAHCIDPAMDNYLNMVTVALDAWEKNESGGRWERLVSHLVLARTGLSEELSDVMTWVRVFSFGERYVSVPERFTSAPVSVPREPWLQDEYLETLDDLVALEV